VSTHGKRICYEGTCRGTLVAGLLPSLLPAGPGTKAEKLHALTHQGVTYAKGEKTGLEYLVLNADFFRFHYPSGLENSLVFLNACQSFGPQATDLVDAIQGSTSVVFGWTESVYVADATATATVLFEALGERGYPAEIALEHIEDLRFGEATPHGPAPELRLRERSEGDLRIREVVSLLDPGSGAVLSGSDLVSIQGTQNDGLNDLAPYLVRVDGVKENLAAGMTVRLSLNGSEATTVGVSSGERNDQDQWLISGTLPLGFDLKQETNVQLAARVNLHSGGESKHESGARLTGDEPIMGTEWKFEAVQTFRYSAGIPHTPRSANTTLTLRFAPGQSASEPNPRYIITGGSVTYDWNHSYYECTYSAPVLTFEVTPDVSLTSQLTFHTTSSPVRYSGLIHTFGPQFESSETCGEETETRTHRANNTWLNLETSQSRAVSTDRRSASGQYRVTGAGGDFIIESNYTITRVR
jgi:hypothetical protein